MEGYIERIEERTKDIKKFIYQLQNKDEFVIDIMDKVNSLVIDIESLCEDLKDSIERIKKNI